MFKKKIESFNISSKWALVITFAIFIVTGAAMLVWLLPILYTQLQAFVLDVPELFNNFLEFVSTLPAKFPELVTSEQITVFFQAVSSELSSITQNIVKILNCWYSKHDYNSFIHNIISNTCILFPFR